MTTNAHSSAGAHGQTPEWLLPDHPRWEEQKARLWAMTPDERVRAMHAGELSMRLCLHSKRSSRSQDGQASPPVRGVPSFWR